MTVGMYNNDADSWANTLTIFCSNCGDGGSFFNFGLPFMRCALSCIALLGEMLVMATLLIRAPIPVHSLHHPLLFSLLKFLVSAASKVPYMGR